jgi:hypothetical protein
MYHQLTILGFFGFPSDSGRRRTFWLRLGDFIFHVSYPKQQGYSLPEAQEPFYGVRCLKRKEARSVWKLDLERHPLCVVTRVCPERRRGIRRRELAVG